MRNTAFNISAATRFLTEECCNCGVLFAVSEDLIAQWRKTKRSFYCPNGHSQSYTESEADRLKRELERVKRDADWQKQRAESIEKRLIAQKGQLTKLKKRVGNGVCPCCKRTFKQLAQHMAHKHPEYAVESAASVDAVDPVGGRVTG